MGMYRHIGVAVGFSPTLAPLLAETARHALNFDERLSVIHAGSQSLEKEDQLRTAIARSGLPEDTPILWTSGKSPEHALLRAIDEHEIDMLIAGALDQENAFRYYLGSVARDLARRAPCSLLLFTRPSKKPEPFRRIVVITDYSEAAAIALGRAERLAAREEAQQIYVLRVLSTYGEAMVLSEGVSREERRHYHEHHREEETSLLHDFIDAAGRSATSVEAVLLEGHPGRVTSQFAQDNNADLLVMPSLGSHQPHFFERLFPSQMEWVLREIPCPLWIVR